MDSGLKVYIAFPIQKEIIQKEYKTCEIHEDKIYNDDETYCCLCGSKLVLKIRNRQEYKDISDLLGEDDIFQEDFDIDNNIHAIWSNYCPVLKVCEVGYDKEYIEITPSLIEEAINKFKSHHKKHIEKLEKVLNQKLEVKFGYFE